MPSTKKSNRWIILAAALALGVPTSSNFAPFLSDVTVAAEPTKESADAVARAQAIVDKGIEFLKSQQQPDGGFQQGAAPPAITALALKAIVKSPKYDAKTPFVQKGYEKLVGYQFETGGIYKDVQANYNTAIAVSALAAAENPAYRDKIDKAVAYLKTLQWNDTIAAGPKGEKNIDVGNPWYGGWGYGSKGRPDMSNSQFAIEALHESGVKPEDPAFQAAIKFMSRVQNRSESNDQPYSANDGGAIYGPAPDGKGESMAGEYTDASGKRILRSYGSMTYAMLKSYIYAGLTRDDPRVKAAWDWIRKNWTLDINPGMEAAGPQGAESGLYYYYHTLARALNVFDQPVIEDMQGKKHDWRVELIDKLASNQKENGSWVGQARWMETNPVLVTSMAVLSLQEAIDDLKQHPVAK